MSVQAHISSANQEFQQAVSHLKEEFKGLQIGRANGSLVESIQVESYGSTQPLKNIANISIPDAQTIQIKPWDRSTLGSIEKAITESPLHLNPNNDGETIRLSIPPLTEERRKDLCKLVKQMEEHAHISIRTARQKAHDRIKAMQKDKELTEDEARNADKQLQDKVDEANKEIKNLSKQKEEDIMKV